MERQLFTWEAWDEIDDLVMVYYDVTLNMKIGPFDIGTKFDHANINYEEGLLELYKADTITTPHKFALSFEVREQ